MLKKSCLIVFDDGKFFFNLHKIDASTKIPNLMRLSCFSQLIRNDIIPLAFVVLIF